MDQLALVQYRYRAVCEVLGGSPIGEVAVRYGTTRQSLDSLRARFKQEGMAGLVNRSRRRIPARPSWMLMSRGWYVRCVEVLPGP